MAAKRMFNSGKIKLGAGFIWIFILVVMIPAVFAEAVTVMVVVVQALCDTLVVLQHALCDKLVVLQHALCDTLVVARGSKWLMEGLREKIPMTELIMHR